MLIIFKEKSKQVFHHLKAIIYYIEMIRPLYVLRDFYSMIKNQTNYIIDDSVVRVWN